MRDDPCRPALAESPRGALLSASEQSVVALSLFDSRSTVEPPRHFALFLARVFGGAQPSRLANRRLELLRRYCVLVRVGDASGDPAQTRRMHEAGYSEEALAEVRRLVARGVGRP